MIKAVSVYTCEIDDIELACRQLKSQLDEKLFMMANTVGIVQCDPEFIEAGIMEPLYRELGFPLAGGTTVASATNGTVGNMMFSLLVMTSDDVDFAVSHTIGFKENCNDAVAESFAQAKPRSQAPLRLVLVFPPIIDDLAGDSYVEAIEKVCGKTPVFGNLSVDDSLDSFDRSASVCNNSVFRYEMSYVLFFGNVTPRFFLATVSKQSNLVVSSAVITKASGNIVYEINNMSAIEVFESVGLANNGTLKEGTKIIPLLMTLPDSTDNIPFVRALIRTDPDGSAVFRGIVIEGASFTFGSYFGADVLSSTFDTVSRIKQEKNIDAALLFSCIIRQLVIGADFMRELTQVKNLLGDDIPFMASYAGGEISPTSVDCENNANNRFHNYTFISCLL
jgi:hypothetical protein